MRYVLVYILLLLRPLSSYCQYDVAQRIVLLGNASEAVKDNNGFLGIVRQSIVFDSNTYVFFLGNNVSGPFDTLALQKEAAIAANTDARVFFIPGYQDWAKGEKEGYKGLLQQQQYIDGLRNKNIKMLPADACPGPKSVELNKDVELVILNTQWWLHGHHRPGIESDCKYRSEEEVVVKLKGIVKDNFDKLVIVAAYHPMYNTGPHSATFGIKQHLFPFTDLRKRKNFFLPLPVVGSIYPIIRNAASFRQDMNHQLYRQVAETGIGSLPGIRKQFEDHPNTIFISGQEHSLQLLYNGRQYSVVSGASSVPGRVRRSDNTVYAARQQGFAVLEILKSKKARIVYYTVSGNTVKQAFTTDVADFSQPPVIADDTAGRAMVHADSTTVSAHRRFNEVSGLKRFLAGENYRRIWGADVKVRVFHLDKEKGNLKIKGLGGRNESRGIDFEDNKGSEWALRPVNKNIQKIVPEGYQGTFVNDLVNDMMSSQDPYASSVIPGLAAALGIPHSSPEQVFVPNDSALAEYRPLVANKVCHFEERKNGPGNEDLLSTYEAVNTMVSDGSYYAAQHGYLKCRMLDILISDFDRHYAQWNWSVINSGRKKMLYPVPKDRDQAFYYNDGLVMKLLRHGQYGYVVNFDKKVNNMKDHGIIASYMDMYFLNRLSEHDWHSSITAFRNELTDSVIDEAVLHLPREIYALQGPAISAKLKTRRNSILDKWPDYYKFLSRKVNVLGSNDDNLFRVAGNDSGLSVTLYVKNESGDTMQTYFRHFDPSVTKEIRLYGFNGNDYFHIDESAKGKVRIRIIGGNGTDTFNIRGKVKNWLYDLSGNDNAMLARSHTTAMFSSNPAVNKYQFKEDIYNSTRAPVIYPGLDLNGGIYLAAGASRTTYGFRKSPYATQQRLINQWSFTNKTYTLRYEGEFIDLYKHYDIVPKARLDMPALNYFYGYGNETQRDVSRSTAWYQARYSVVTTDVMARKRMLSEHTMSLYLGPSVYYYWMEQKPNRGHILECPSDVGLDSLSVYKDKMYLGGKLAFSFNNLNSEFMPGNGINWKSEFTFLKPAGMGASPFTSLTSALDVYATLSPKAGLIAAIHLGGGHIFSDHFEYFQAMTLGGNNFLRGFPMNRFAGSSMAYGSVELKVKLFSFNAYLLKGDFGLVGFNDLGKVWVRNQSSTKWHNGYGGGVYLVPFKKVMLSLVVAFSDEDVLLNAGVGTKANITFQR